MTRPLPHREPAAGDPQALTDFCPGILHAVPAKDGMLMRLRLPGGVLPPATLAAIAELAARHGDGHLDLTARANIQLRGIGPAQLKPMTEGLARAGLLPSASHERIRNILVSPFAGVDPDEHIDLTGLAQALDRALIADAALAQLPAKFAFTLDGGGLGFDPGGADLTLTAVAPDRLHLSLAGQPTGLGTAPDAAVALLIRAAHATLVVAQSHDLPARGRSIGRVPAAYDEFRTGLAAKSCSVPAPRQSAPGFGIVAGTLLPVVPLGRLSSAQALALADAARQFGFDMRLTPWRNLALRGVAAGDLPALTATLASLGLSLDGRDGFAGLAACAGSAGCAAALGDVRHDARRFAESVASTAPTAGWAMHVAGCAKRCAMRGPAVVDLIATQNGYDVLFDGVVALTGLAPDEALAAARTAYRTKALQTP
ncbi:precorrin-3B synthase [Aliidongia dinghuensis]|uniref:Precorrin-3B synthase n=1 Tax=Aliidongia dinghuensis TaxID=1867774 RepID=A0A8J2YQM1_9PROT|nr:precorrin-3B synthase [Aliidongia dinghuensis]GGF06099.1 precorrin-3B synthase [Aliidongia dinghuensis]